MKIEKAKIRDFLEIAALDREVWGNNRHSTFIPDGEHVWRLWVEHALVFVTKGQNQKVIGAILAFPCLNGTYCVHKVMVEYQMRGKGIGSRLFEGLLQVIDKEGASSFLTVDPENSSAIQLYEKWGYVEKHFAKGYYRENEDRYILTRPVKS